VVRVGQPKISLLFGLKISYLHFRKFTANSSDSMYGQRVDAVNSVFIVVSCTGWKVLLD
jgi:hypothetical protein